MTMRPKSLSALLIISGFLCIVSALGLTSYNLITEKRAGAESEKALVTMSEMIPQAAPIVSREDIPVYQIDPHVSMPEKTIDGVKYIGYLHIPDLGLKLPVITKTTNRLLQIAPCRLSGTAYMGDLVIGAHNYNTHFGRLKDLTYGDVIEYVDMDGNLFRYEVYDIEILQPDQLEYLCAGDYPLSLYTCTVGGRTRLTLRCVEIN